jgi:hypothetical protein
MAWTAAKSPSEAMGKPASMKLMRQTQLFRYVHAAARRLFAVAQRGVEYLDP